MYETFENLPESKREHIIEVCIEEFAQNGYNNTSTNTIVKRLGISKGVLFLYFKSKRNLFLYITDYLRNLLTDEFFERFSEREPAEFIDIFDHMGKFYYILLQKKPQIVVFLLEAVLNTPAELREEIETKHNQAHDILLKKININNVRNDIEVQKVLDLLHMASYYIGQMIFREYGGELSYFKENADRYIKVYEQYIDIIKYGVYEK